MPASFPMRRAACMLSPVMSTGFTPTSFNFATLCLTFARSVSERAMKPHSSPSTAIRMTVQPSSSSERTVSDRRASFRRTACSEEKSRAFPTRTECFPMRAATPRPGIMRKSSGAASGRSARSGSMTVAQRSTAFPSGCSERDSAEAARR